MKDLIHEALDTAQKLGAEYADVRGIRFRRQQLSVHDLRPHEIRDNEELGSSAAAPPHMWKELPRPSLQPITCFTKGYGTSQGPQTL